MLSSLASNMSKSFKLETNFVSDLCEVINSPRSLTVALLIRFGEWQQLADLSIDPNHYDDPSNFADDYQVTEALRKSPNLPLLTNRRDQALESFWLSELSCFATNDRLRNRASHYDREIMMTIARILGPLDEHALLDIERRFRHGPGATASLRGLGSVPSDKFDKSISLTIDLYPFYKSVLGSNWHSANKKPAQIVGGNKFTTVPKNAKTDRGIAAEPTLNMYVQLGIGSYIRSRLNRFGVDLNDQSVNQELARNAYFYDLATIDLSAASDSLATEIILKYFPPDWAELLCLARSHRCFIDGHWHELEKFSSMGNGFTFELESLLFYSIARSIVPRSELDYVGVYGDDIIIPARHTDAVIETLNFLGFSVNTRKSFLAGNFFESCGSDWFKGFNVRPFYLKGSKGDIPYSVQICNKLRLWARRITGSIGCDPRFRQLWLKYYTLAPRNWKKCKVPAVFGDTGLIMSLREAQPERCEDQLEGYAVRHIYYVPVQRRKGTFSFLLSQLPRGALYQIESDSATSDRLLDAVFDSYWYTRGRIGCTQSLTEFIRREVERSDSVATHGREAVRGYLGKARSKKSIVSKWTDGLEWLE